MREIIPQRLWLGDALDARDARRLLDAEILAIVDLALEEPPAQLPREMVYGRIPLVDGAENSDALMQLAVESAAALIRKQIPTLVACSAGLSRSPAIAAAALAFVSGESPDDHLRSIIGAAPHHVSPPLWADVKQALQALAGGEHRGSTAAGE